MPSNPARTGYAPVNGLNLYYEVHGEGPPMVLLHGAFMNIELTGPLIPGLAETRQVIAVELQGHGHTADRDSPFSHEQMADDVAGLLRHLGIKRADVCGYSLGGLVAWQVALRHPELVRKLVAISATYTTEGMYPEAVNGIAALTPEMLSQTPLLPAYQKVAPNPDGFGNLVTKLVQLASKPRAWPADAIKSLATPTLIVIGDSDGIRPEHAAELFRLRGGGVFGDYAGLPASQLAILPGTTHTGLLMRPDLLVAIISPFLDA